MKNIPVESIPAFKTLMDEGIKWDLFKNPKIIRNVAIC